MKISAAAVMRQRATAAIARLVRDGVISTGATSLASGLRRDTSAPPDSQGGCPHMGWGVQAPLVACRRSPADHGLSGKLAGILIGQPELLSSDSPSWPNGHPVWFWWPTPQ